MISLYVFLACLLVLGGLLWLARRSGRQVERGQAAEDSNEVKDEQLEVAVDGPRTKEQVVERLRKRRL